MSEAYATYRTLMTSGRFEDAARLAEAEYLQDDASNPFWLTRQAAALSRARRLAPALDVAQRALALQPDNPYALLAAAEALQGAKKIEEALLHYEAVADHPRLSAAARRGILECLLALKQWHRILELVERWGLPPEKSRRWRVQALVGLERWEEAASVCRCWLQSQPDHPPALWALTDIEIRREGLPAVLARMGKLAKIPGRPPVYREIYASLCRRAGKPELALAQYAEMTRGATDTKILRKQAFALSAAGRKSAAVPMLEELLKIDPKDYYAHTSYLGACRKTNQLERAARFYAELVAQYPEEKSLYGRIKKIEGLRQVENSRDRKK